MYSIYLIPPSFEVLFFGHEGLLKGYSLIYNKDVQALRLLFA